MFEKQALSPEQVCDMLCNALQHWQLFKTAAAEW